MFGGCVLSWFPNKTSWLSMNKSSLLLPWHGTNGTRKFFTDTLRHSRRRCVGEWILNGRPPLLTAQYNFWYARQRVGRWGKTRTVDSLTRLYDRNICRCRKGKKIPNESIRRFRCRIRRFGSLPVTKHEVKR